ncbi:MAG: hypothetical protein SFV17_12255 [Candidatus Obscuribacter sp.]|nr:hypothetical protein [Candidatus Melainabacteria bacterium]MDX1987453.1 hypothetical protein [Candidatus Obscuribacter sp.]
MALDIFPGDFDSKEVTPGSQGFKGISFSHHGELMQGLFRRADRTPVRALITLPSPQHKTEATFYPDRSAVIRAPQGRTKAARAAEITLRTLRRADTGGRLEIESNIEIGAGLGSSASDVTATILAVAKSANIKLKNSEIAKIALAAESAYDPVVYGNRPLLWAQREAEIVEDFGDQLPALAVLGFSLGSGVDTLAFKMPDYTPHEQEVFELLRSTFRRAIKTGNLDLIGRVATRSAEINQRYLEKPHFEELKDIVSTCGALGLQVSHTGSIVGMLFDPYERFFLPKIQEAKRLLLTVNVSSTWLFQTDMTNEVK